MTDKSTRLPSEPDSQPNPDKPWYRLSPGAWTLLGILFLLNVVNLLIPGLLASVLQNMDIRLWPDWYFGVLAAALFVSVVWYWGTSRVRSATGKENQS